MRTFVEVLNVRACRWCGADIVDPGEDVDAGVIRLDPVPVLGVDAVRKTAPVVAWGWSYTGRYWRVHRFADDPLAYAFLEHSCSGDSLTKGDSMTADPFGSAAPPGATGPDCAELEGKLILLTVHSIERGVVTKFGPGEAVRCDVVDLGTGEAFADNLLFGKVLVNQLTPGIRYVGRITKGQAVPPNSPPWTWADGDENDKAVGVRYLTYAASQSVASAPAAPAPAPVATPVAPAAPVAPVAPAAPVAAAPPWAQ